MSEGWRDTRWKMDLGYEFTLIIDSDQIPGSWKLYLISRDGSEISKNGPTIIGTTDQAKKAALSWCERIFADATADIRKYYIP